MKNDRLGVSLHRPATVFIAFVVDLAFALCLLGFLVMHARLVAANCTTIEMFEKRRVPQWPYDRGFRSNFQEVFGCRCLSANALILHHSLKCHGPCLMLAGHGIPCKQLSPLAFCLNHVMSWHDLHAHSSCGKARLLIIAKCSEASQVRRK